MCFGDLDINKHSKFEYHTSDKAMFKMIMANGYVNMQLGPNTMSHKTTYNWDSIQCFQFWKMKYYKQPVVFLIPHNNVSIHVKNDQVA